MLRAHYRAGLRFVVLRTALVRLYFDPSRPLEGEVVRFLSRPALAAFVAGLDAVNFSFESRSDVLTVLVALGR